MSKFIHDLSQCEEAGVLTEFGRRDPAPDLNEIRQCSCGRWWRCKSPKWHTWVYMSPRQHRKWVKRPEARRAFEAVGQYRKELR